MCQSHGTLAGNDQTTQAARIIIVRNDPGAAGDNSAFETTILENSSRTI